MIKNISDARTAMKETPNSSEDTFLKICLLKRPISGYNKYPFFDKKPILLEIGYKNCSAPNALLLNQVNDDFIEFIHSITF